MNLFFDTSVLVAAFVQTHPHYSPAFTALELVRTQEHQGWISQHTVAEVYATLTALPVHPRIYPSLALRILEDNVLPYCQVVTLDPGDYRVVIRDLAAKDWRSGKIFDALHLHCAKKQPIDRIYTFNVRDFRQLAPELQDKIAAP